MSSDLRMKSKSSRKSAKHCNPTWTRSLICANHAHFRQFTNLIKFDVWLFLFEKPSKLLLALSAFLKVEINVELQLWNRKLFHSHLSAVVHNFQLPQLLSNLIQLWWQIDASHSRCCSFFLRLWVFKLSKCPDQSSSFISSLHNFICDRRRTCTTAKSSQPYPWKCSMTVKVIQQSTSLEQIRRNFSPSKF